MRWIPLSVVPMAVLVAPQYVHASVYLDVEQAQQLMLPGARFVQVLAPLTDAQREQMRERSGVREPFKADRIWRASTGGWFIVDEVVGKHEMIKYAVALGVDGTVRAVEILEYRETYGFEVREAGWRRQFEGKTVASPLKLNQDIRNISGATLSCKHVTDGVKRLLVLHELALKGAA